MIWNAGSHTTRENDIKKAKKKRKTNQIRNFERDLKIYKIFFH